KHKHARAGLLRGGHVLSAYADVLNGGADDDFDQQLRTSQLGFASSACRHVGFVSPLAPDFVHTSEVTCQVGQPDLNCQQLGFVGTGFSQETVDLGQCITCLAFDVSIDVSRSNACNVGNAVMNHDAAEAFVAVDSLNLAH